MVPLLVLISRWNQLSSMSRGATTVISRLLGFLPACVSHVKADSGRRGKASALVLTSFTMLDVADDEHEDEEDEDEDDEPVVHSAAPWHMRSRRTPTRPPPFG